MVRRGHVERRWDRIPPAAVPPQTRCAIPPGSVNEYQRKIGSKRAYHVMH